MVFSSYVFLFLFLPATLIVYFLLPLKGKNLWLLFTSLFFYGWNNPKYLLILLVSILINWCTGLLLERISSRKKPIIVLGISANLLLLLYFKYANFLVNNLAVLFPRILNSWTTVALPLGISFFTFQGLSYIIDVYRGDTNALRNPLDVGLYISLFPQLVAGPIVRFKSVAAEIKQRTISIENVGYGFRRFVYGLSKKVILADTFGMIADGIFSSPSTWNLGNSWIGILAYTFQIYYDFSGYSDMAIGLGSILGFHFNENFNYPYISKSVTEFWRRWHMSLSSWFRDYVYIPCGGNRVTRRRHIFNIMLVWLLTGIWHGANWTFICWGIYYGLLLLFEKYILGEKINRIFPPVRWIMTLLLVMIGWVIFRCETLGLAKQYLLTMFRFSVTDTEIISFLRYLTNYAFFLVLGFVGIFPIKEVALKLKANEHVRPWMIAIAENIYVFVLFIISVLYIISGSYSAFIYFQF